MFLFAMAYATLRERYTQHEKTGSFILWLTLSLLWILIFEKLAQERSPERMNFSSFITTPNTVRILSESGKRERTINNHSPTQLTTSTLLTEYY
jgi:hypothetical protein